MSDNYAPWFWAVSQELLIFLAFITKIRLAGTTLTFLQNSQFEPLVIETIGDRA
jgi:hypothetical protein